MLLASSRGGSWLLARRPSRLCRLGGTLRSLEAPACVHLHTRRLHHCIPDRIDASTRYTRSHLVSGPDLTGLSQQPLSLQPLPDSQPRRVHHRTRAAASLSADAQEWCAAVHRVAAESTHSCARTSQPTESLRLCRCSPTAPHHTRHVRSPRNTLTGTRAQPGGRAWDGSRRRSATLASQQRRE